jgi:ParB-like chromosome segregation protein Spo0J
MQNLPIGKIKANPNNPRTIKDDKFFKLVQSLKDLPEMAKVRPVVVNQDMVVLGGNMRLKAMKEAGWKEAPVEIVDWDEDKQRQFIIKDNVGFGEWDWEMLANEWDAEQLDDWGLTLPIFDTEPSAEELIGDDKNKPATMKITFDSPEQLQQAEIEIQELLDRKYPKAFFSVSAGEI